MFENLKNFFKKSENSTKILYKKPKKPINLSPKHLLKQFLRWFRLKDATGELLVKQDTFINDILADWNRRLILWLISIMGAGFLIMMAILPFYTIPFGFKTFTYMFSFGLCWYLGIELIKDIRNAIRRG